jgi:hypothetical protein
MTQSISQFSDWQVPAPSQQMIEAGRKELIAELRRQGWTLGDTTLVRHLGTTVRLGHQLNVPTHVTIGIDELDAVVRYAMTKGIGTVGAVAARAMKTCPYHVTIAEADKLYAQGNPRWFSDSGSWTAHDDLDADAPDVQAALKGATTALAR